MCIWTTILFLKPQFWYSFHSVSSFVNPGRVRSCRSSKAVLGFGCFILLHYIPFLSNKKPLQQDHLSTELPPGELACCFVFLPVLEPKRPSSSAQHRRLCRFFHLFRPGWVQSPRKRFTLLSTRATPCKPVRLPRLREICCSAQGWQKSGPDRNPLCLLCRAAQWRAPEIFHFSIPTKLASSLCHRLFPTSR